MFKAFAIACTAAVAMGLKVNDHQKSDKGGNGANHPEIKFKRQHGDGNDSAEAILAQTGTMADNLTCQYGENRNKAEVDNFW